MSWSKHLTRARHLLRVAGTELTLAAELPDFPLCGVELLEEISRLVARLNHLAPPGGKACGNGPDADAAKQQRSAGETG